MDDCGIGGQRYMYSWTKIWMIVELVDRDTCIHGLKYG